MAAFEYGDPCRLPTGLVAGSDIDVVKAVFAAFAERDVEGVLAHADADIVFSPVTGDYAGRTEPYRGHDGMRQYFRDVAEVWDELRIVPASSARAATRSSSPAGSAPARPPASSPARPAGSGACASGLVIYARVYASAAEAIAAFEGRGA